MSIDRIILHFAQREKAPVQVEDVVAHIRSLHVTDEIYFFDVKLNTEVLKGKIDHWSYPLSESGPERYVAVINTADSLSEDWKRRLPPPRTAFQHRFISQSLMRLVVL